MNRFRNKNKKVPEPLHVNEDVLSFLSGAPAQASSSQASSAQSAPVSPGLKKSGTSRWKRNKKQVEVKPALDLSLALPSSDDFRTSLLMPHLGARFSMLREQDDPNSMLGKAMDDSVLQPRRRSRMDFGGLGDIAEVSSIKSQKIRPPFAQQDSFASSEDGYASDSGSMMSRARRGEGNTLFGGRQKVYMIPKVGPSSSRSLGKQVYDDDIGLSAFQKYKRERQLLEGRTSDESQGFDFGLDQAGPGDQDYGHASTPNDSAKDLSHSPSLSSSDRKRSTNSTSHSEARSSTAATSVASQSATIGPSPAQVTSQPVVPPLAVPPPLKRADTKTRRLYEQGLDQHMYEQQTSALTRLNSIQRQRNFPGAKQPPPYLQSTKSASNLHEQARQPVYALRSQSPENMPPLMNNLGPIRKPVPRVMSPVGSGPQSPVSPISPDEGNALTQALDPADRGKATAMGAFDKPKQSFDENQYMERQRQLQRTNSSAAIKREPSAPSFFQQRVGRFEFERERSDSDLSARSRSGSGPKQNEPPPVSSAYNVFQRAAQMNAQSGTTPVDKPPLPDTHRTFFGNISASDSEEEEDDQPRYTRQPYHAPDYGYGTHHGRWQPSVLPSVLEHPALRSQKSKASLAEVDEDDEPMPLRTVKPLRSPQPETIQEPQKEEDVDSPTLGPGASAAPLNGLMHHLRQQSDQSSIFQGDAPTPNEVPDIQRWEPKNLDLIHPPSRNTADSDSPYASSNPWDLEDMSNAFRGGERASRASVSPLDGPRPSAQFDSRAPSRSNMLSRQSEVSELEPEPELEPEGDNDSSWQSELQKQHTRDPSTATQQDREAFEKELEARRKAVQENIKSKIEQETRSRDTSPAPSARHPVKGAFGMLRSRPSRESVDNGQRPMPSAAPKAMKMLGIAGGSAHTSSNLPNSQYERGGYSLDIGRHRDDSASRPPISNNKVRALQQSDEDVRREWQQSRSRENSVSRPAGQPQAARSPPSSTDGRSRANSAATSGRSRSRTGPYRDDLEKAMIEGTGSSASVVLDPAPIVPRELTPRPSPDMVPHQFEDSRARSNSRTGMTNYFEQKNLQPIQTGSRERLSPGGPSPAQTPNLYSPSINSARSPTSPFMQSMTPPLSGTNTPVSSSFSPPLVPQSSGQSTRPLRKKTISKIDISEPTLVTSTSNVDLVDLPEGASLRNGMDEPPPLPPINPRRRATKAMFGFGRKDSENSIADYNSGRSKTPDPWVSKPPVEPEPSFEVARGQRSGYETRSPRMPVMSKQSLDYNSGMRQYGFPPNSGSPERGARSPVPPVPVEGGMF